MSRPVRRPFSSAMKTPKAAQLAIIAGGGYDIQLPLALAQAYYREWIDPTIGSTIAGSPVSKIIYPVADGFTQRRNFQRSTSNSPADRPAITASRLVFDGSNDCLDGSAGYTYVGATRPADTFYCEPGKGPTTTGLSRDVAGTGWWLGGFGKKNQATAAGETFDGGPIHYNNDFQQIIQEIRFQNLSLPGVGMQGLTLDYTVGVPTGSIWCADPITGKIFLIDPAGPTVTRTLTFVGANGLAYDTINDQLWVCVANSATITRINKTTGATVTTFTHRDLTDNQLDMLFFDGSYGTAGALYTTGRDNGSNGRIVKYDLATFTPIKAWSISEIQSMEGGLHVTGSTFDTCDDEYYHSQVANVNRVVATTADTGSPDYGTKLVIACVAKIAATPGSTVTLVVGGDPLNASPRGAGLFYTAASNQIRLVCNWNGTPVTINWTLASSTTETGIYVVMDSIAHTATLYENGTINGTAQSDANITGSMPSLVWTLGAYYGATALPTLHGAVSIGQFTVSNRNDRAEIEGDQAWQTSHEAWLPGGHTYALVSPRGWSKKVSDTFTDSDAVVLTAHTGELGATWTVASGTGVPTVQTNRIFCATAACTIKASGGPIMDGFVEAVYDLLTDAADNLGLAFRYQAGADSGYVLRYGQSADTWALFRVDAGVFSSSLGTYSDNWTTGSRTVRLDARGSTIRVLIDGVERYTVTDAIYATGFAGLRWGAAQTTTTGRHVTSFTAVGL